MVVVGDLNARVGSELTTGIVGDYEVPSINECGLRYYALSGVGGDNRMSCSVAWES